MFSMLLSAVAVAVCTTVEDTPWPHLCSTTGGSETRCPSDATCCKSKYSASTQGCCPWQNAVCCSNGLTCCPQGTTCSDFAPQGWPSWGVTTTCIPTASGTTADTVAVGAEALLPTTKDGAAAAAAAAAAGSVTGKCVCKPGAPLSADPARKNVVVIGDSVSLGYTPVVASIMAATTLVQHAPWGGDGGAEETAYGLQCIDYWLRYSNGSAFTPDLVYFNFGLHDGPQLFNLPPANVTIPGQEGNMTVYAPELAAIAAKLTAFSKATGAKLLFGITSPMMNNLRADQDVVELNRRAASVMAAAAIPTINLHDAVVGKCGAVPQAKCLGIPNCFSPHCGTAGYAWLANTTIVPAFKKALGL